MRDVIFEESLTYLGIELGKCADAVKIKAFKKPQLITFGLTYKALSHCAVALNLVAAEASPEAMIILRSAYEAMIKSIYLRENEAWLEEYEAFSELVTLRNQLEVVKILDEFDEPEDSKIELRAQIADQQKLVVDAGYHTLFNIDETKLGDWASLKSKTNSAHLQKFETIRQNVKKTELVKALLITGFQAYNLGSQMAHSSFNMVSSMVYFNRNQPLYPERALYRQILLLVGCAIEQYTNLGLLDETDHKKLMAKVLDIAKRHLAEDDSLLNV